MTAPSQWEKLMTSVPPMPGKKYLLPPEKPTTSCGKDRAADDELVIVQHQLVERHRHVLAHQPAGQLRDLGGGDGADGGEGAGQVPVVVEDVHAGIAAGALLGGDAHQPVQRLLAHGLVRAQGHQIVQRGGRAAQLLVKQAEEERDGRRARAVGDDHQHPLALQGAPARAWRTRSRTCCSESSSVGGSCADEHGATSTSSRVGSRAAGSRTRPPDASS